MAIDKAEASRLLRGLKEDRYNSRTMFDDDSKINAIERRQRDIVRLLDLICKGEEVQ